MFELIPNRSPHCGLKSRQSHWEKLLGSTIWCLSFSVSDSICRCLHNQCAKKPTDIFVTLPTVAFVFKETNQKSLEEIDLLFGERALGTLPENLTEKDLDNVTHHVEDRSEEPSKLS